MFAVSLVLVGIKRLKALQIDMHHYQRLVERLCGEVWCVHTWKVMLQQFGVKKVWVFGGTSWYSEYLQKSFDYMSSL